MNDEWKGALKSSANVFSQCLAKDMINRALSTTAAGRVGAELGQENRLRLGTSRRLASS